MEEHRELDKNIAMEAMYWVIRHINKFNTSLGFCNFFLMGMDDCWCGDQPLKYAFPVLYESAIDRAASVESLLVRQVVGERRGWDEQFLHDFNNWELELDLVTAFLHCIVS